MVTKGLRTWQGLQVHICNNYNKNKWLQLVTNYRKMKQV